MQKINLTNESLKWGIIAGIITSVIHIGSWSLGLQTYVSALSIEMFVPYIMLLFLFVGLNIRKQNSDFLTFQEALKFVFLAYVIVALIEAINTYILYNVIDPNLTEKVLSVTKEKTIKTLEKIGATKEQIKEAMNRVDAESKDTNFKKIFLGLGINLIWYFVKSLLISIVIKKEQKLDETLLA